MLILWLFGLSYLYPCYAKQEKFHQYEDGYGLYGNLELDELKIELILTRTNVHYLVFHLTLADAIVCFVTMPMETIWRYLEEVL